MKVLILADPGNTHTIKWVNSLSNQGITINVFGLSNYNSSDYPRKNIVINTIGFDDAKGSSYKMGLIKKLKYLLSLPKLLKIIKKFKPDIIHAHYATSYGLLGALSMFHPYIISVWGSDVYEFPKKSYLHKKILQFNLKKADLILSTSQIMAKQINLYTSKPISITPFGVDIEKFTPSNKKKSTDNQIIIGTVKALRPIYGIDYLIRAFKSIKQDLPNKKLKLKIIGGGDEIYKNELIDLSCELGIEADVDFIDRVPNNDIPKHLNSMDIFVALSNYESFGVAVIEASACEVPVVVSDAPGLKEVVDDKHTGLVVPAQNESAAARAIMELLCNKEVRRAYGRNGRNKVKAQYNWNDNVDQMIQLYKKILNERN